VQLVYYIYKESQLGALREELLEFMYSLKEERLTFELGVEQMLAAKLLVVARSESGEWLGCAGLRKKWGLGLFFLVVHRDIQGLGKGKALSLKVLSQWPKWKPLLLKVSRVNHRARKLYEEIGFIEFHRDHLDMFMMFGSLSSMMFWPIFKVAALSRRSR
jgi:GNAT superfamily N-acetyltransferase